ncbi:MAG TPA: hypothetical protein VF988_15560 [Verrucomicrobiae bacterium]
MRLGLRWQSGSGDTAFARAEIEQTFHGLSAGESGVALPLPAAVQDATGLAVTFAVAKRPGVRQPPGALTATFPATIA